MDLGEAGSSLPTPAHTQQLLLDSFLFTWGGFHFLASQASFFPDVVSLLRQKPLPTT